MQRVNPPKMRIRLGAAIGSGLPCGTDRPARAVAPHQGDRRGEVVIPTVQVAIRSGRSSRPATDGVGFALVRALRREALAAGVAIYEGTPALDVADGVVTTPRGRVRASAIVVATNAAAAGWRPVRRHVTNFRSYVVLTEPAPRSSKRRPHDVAFGYTLSVR